MDKNIKERWEAIDQGLVPKGYKKTKVGIVPEDWKIKNIENLSKKINVGFVGTCEKYYTEKSNGIPMLRTGNISEKKIRLHELKYVTRDFHNNNKKSQVKRGDILISRHGSNGEAALYLNEEIVNCLNIIIVTPNTILVNKYYLYYIINSTNINRLILKKIGGSTQKVVNLADIKTTPIPIPPLEEQGRIADILSTWDRAIESYGKLLEEKKERKKGLMQLLLTGEKRLGGFSGPWKEVRLGEIGETYNGLTGKNKNDFGTGEKFITYKNIFDNSRVDIDNYGLVEIEKNEKQNVIKYGDIIFTTSSETSHEVGMSSVVLEDIDENIYLNSFCFGFRLNKENTLNPVFSRYYFRGNKFRKDIFKLAQGSTRFNLSKNELMKIKIRIPDLEEQKAIAEVLGIADREIELLEKLIEGLEEEKKGLMQLLLKGIVRV